MERQVAKRAEFSGYVKDKNDGPLAGIKLYYCPVQYHYETTPTVPEIFTNENGYFYTDSMFCKKYWIRFLNGDDEIDYTVISVEPDSANYFEFKLDTLLTGISEYQPAIINYSIHKELIDSLVVEDLKTSTVIPYHDARSGIFFEIFVNAYGQSAYRVYFRQRLKEDHFSYILNSTKTWGKSLDFANYELQMPLSIIPDSLNYPPDTSFILNDIRYYKWKKSDFMPDKDLEVFFH